MLEQTQIREIFLSRLVEDILGPRVEDEKLPHDQAPRDQYLSGILYPQDSRISEDEAEESSEESGLSEGGSDDHEDSVLNQRAWLPSSMGISFFVRSESPTLFEIDLNISAGIYRLRLPATPESESRDSSISTEENGSGETICQDYDESVAEKPSAADETTYSIWAREQLSIGPVNLRIRNGQPEYCEEICEGLRLFVEVSLESREARLTVCLINSFTDDGTLDFQARNERCFFQTELSAQGKNGTIIVPRKSIFGGESEDDQLNGLLYRNVKEFATGHTCSADWVASADFAERVSTTWIPVQRVEDVSAAGHPLVGEFLIDAGFTSFDAEFLGNAERSEVVRLLSILPKSYEHWLDDRRRSVERELEADQLHLAVKQLEIAGEVSGRIRAGIDLLAEESGHAFEAFQLANRAMVRQAKWQGYSLQWRPFQIGFVLLSLQSLAKRASGRRIMDLLWFPTGGGKTEAYLGLMAFIIFFRRLEKGGLASSDGVAVLSRYTLRALTTDQFGRTAGLICACELERRLSSAANDSSAPISIGLWIGAASSPNKFEDAKKAIELGTKPGPDQMKICPECKGGLTWSVNNRLNRIEAYCDKELCNLGRTIRPLPIHTVDEQIYICRPSVVIGTVDKFIQVCRFPGRTNPIFNYGTDDLPPDLIIQDELHLISGPLGSIVGLMELAIEKLCSNNGIPPKIIGSTATIQRATQQVSSLFNKELAQFPPPVIEAGDSFFAITDISSSGRKYVGLTTAGRTATYLLQAVTGSLMQSVGDPRFASEDLDHYDPFTTLALYFNSLRILGGARTLLWEDAQKSKRVFAVARGEPEREVNELQELTSLVTQDELKSTLDNLRCKHAEQDHIDVLLASVMISVGVDIPRLGLMVVDGQPKTMAEYIQATSRVGRGRIAGLIVTLYNNLKIRDRAHFESFRSWHSALYRSVEATSVTPFAPRARDKGLKALVVALATRATDIRESDASLTPGRRRIIEDEVVPAILERIRAVDPSEVETAGDEIDSFLEDWEGRGNLRFLWNDFSHPNESLFVSAEAAAQRLSAGGQFTGWAAPNSARDVEPSVVVKVRDKLYPGLLSNE